MMHAAYRSEFIPYRSSFLSVAHNATTSQRSHQFVSYRDADLPPAMLSVEEQVRRGNRLRPGSISVEEMRSLGDFEQAGAIGARHGRVGQALLGRLFTVYNSRADDIRGGRPGRYSVSPPLSGFSAGCLRNVWLLGPSRREGVARPETRPQQQRRNSCGCCQRRQFSEVGVVPCSCSKARVRPFVVEEI